jgi:hypothetical protein
MNARGSDFPSNLGKSIFWNLGGRSLWLTPESAVEPEEPIGSALLEARDLGLEASDGSLEALDGAFDTIDGGG